MRVRAIFVYHFMYKFYIMTVLKAKQLKWNRVKVAVIETMRKIERDRTVRDRVSMKGSAPFRFVS